MATTRLSDKMIRTMLAALRNRNSEGRYEVFDAPRRTVEALITRGKAETLEVAACWSSETGKAVRTAFRTYLTAEGVETLRNGFVTMAARPDGKATEWHRAAVRADWRIARAAAALILGDVANVRAITRTPGVTPVTEDMTAEQAVVMLSLLLTKGQRVEEYGPYDTDERPARLIAHPGEGFHREYEFILTYWGPGEDAEEEQAPARPSMAGLPNGVCKAAEDVKAAYNTEAAELLGDGARFMRTRRTEEDVAADIIDRTEALALVVKALRDDWITGRLGRSVTLVTPGTASYLLEPISEESQDAPAADSERQPVLLKREPWRGGQICGRQTVCGMGAYSERYCGERKAPGEVECAQHATETHEQYGTVRVAPGNAVGDPSKPLILFWEPRESEEPVIPTRDEYDAYAAAYVPPALPYRTVVRDTTARVFNPADNRVTRCEACGDHGFLARDWDDRQVRALCVECHERAGTQQAADGHQCEDWCGMSTDHDGLCAPGEEGEAEERFCEGCGAAPGEPCVPLSMCTADREEAATEGGTLDASEGAAAALAESLVPQAPRLTVQVVMGVNRSTTREERDFVVGLVATLVRAGARYTGNSSSLVLRHETETVTVGLAA